MLNKLMNLNKSILGMCTCRLLRERNDCGSRDIETMVRGQESIRYKGWHKALATDMGLKLFS